MSMLLRRLLMGLVAAAISLSAAATSPSSKTVDTAAVANSYSMADFTHVRKYDVHVHANNPDTAFLEQARADLVAAQKDLADARKDAGQIVAGLAKFNASANASSTTKTNQ